MVDYSGLENRRTERYRGFESLSLRQAKRNPSGLQRVAFLFLYAQYRQPVSLFYDSRLNNSSSTCQMSSMVESSTRSLVEWGSTIRGPMLAICMPG